MNGPEMRDCQLTVIFHNYQGPNMGFLNKISGRTKILWKNGAVAHQPLSLPGKDVTRLCGL